MKALPSLRSHAGMCALAAALLAWSVPAIPLQADDESTPIVDSPQVEDSSVSATPVEPQSSQSAQTAVEAPAPVPAAARDARVRLHELVTIKNSSHLRAEEVTPQMVTVMGSALVDGLVEDNCVTVMGNVTLNGTVRGNLVCVLGQITLGPDADIHGNTVAVGGGLVAAPTARIRGERVAITIPGLGGSFGGWLGDWFQDGLGKARILPHNFAWAWGTALTFILLNVLFAAMFRSGVEATARALETRPVLSAVNGMLVFLFFPILMILLVASVIGIVLVPVAGAGLFFCWFIGTIGVYCFCGQQFGLRDRPVLAALAGNLVFLLLYALPIIGLAVWSVTGLMGLGGAITALGNKRREAREARAAALREQRERQQQNPVPAPVFAPQVQVAPSTPVYMAPPAPTASATPGVSAGFTGAAPAVAVPTQTSGPSTTFVPPYSGWTPPPVTPAAGMPPPPASMAPLPPLPFDETIGRATFWARLGAFAIDFFAVTIAANMMNIERILPFVLIAYHIAFWGWRSTTPGGIVFNLRVVRNDNRPMDYAVAAVRALGGIFSLLPAGLGFIWASFDSEGQAWHDKLAGTSVVNVRKSAPLV